MSDNILELKHITKLYPGVVALNDVSLVNITVRQSRQSGVARATCPD